MFFNLFLLSIFLDLSQIQILFPFLAKVFAQKIVLLFVIIGVFADNKRIENIKCCMNTDIGRVLLLLILWVFLSIPLGVYPGNSFRFITENYWKILLVFLVVMAYLSNRDALDKVVWTYILGVGLMAIVTLLTSSISRMAISDEIYDANDTALQVLLALPFAFWKYRTSQGLRKIIAASICLLILVVLIKTDSRGGFLGLVALGFMIKNQIGQLGNGSLLKIVVLLSVLGGVMLIYGGDEYYTRISTMFNPSDDYNISSSSGRLQVWSRGLDMMLHNPLLGVGVGNFIAADGLLYADIGAHYQAAHNAFVQVGAELGIPGLLLFIGLIWKSVKNIKHMNQKLDIQNSDDLQKIMGYSIIGSWVVYVVSGFFLSAAYISSFYFLLALSIAFINLESLSTHDISENNLQ